MSFRDQAVTEYHLRLGGELGTDESGRPVAMLQSWWDRCNIIQEELSLDSEARGALSIRLTTFCMNGQEASVVILDESWDVPEVDVAEQWGRYGNVWLAWVVEPIGTHEPSGKTIVCNTILLSTVAGGPERHLLLRVDDFLSDRSERPTQSSLRGDVRDRLNALQTAYESSQHA